MIDLLIILWLIGAFVSLGMSYGGYNAKEWKLLHRIIVFAGSWFMVGMTLGIIATLLEDLKNNIDKIK